jgi:hypothetical protein
VAEMYGTVAGYGEDGRLISRPNTRIGQTKIRTTAQARAGQVAVEVDRDGSFQVIVGPKDGPGALLIEGNCNDGERHAADALTGQALWDGRLAYSDQPTREG